MTISSCTTLRSKTTAILSLLIYLQLQFILFSFRHYAIVFINKSYLSDVVDIKSELFSLSLLVCGPSFSIWGSLFKYVKACGIQLNGRA